MNRDDDQQPSTSNQPQSSIDEKTSTSYSHSPTNSEPSTTVSSGQDMPDPLEMPQTTATPTIEDSTPITPEVAPVEQPPVTAPQINPMDDAANGFTAIAKPQKPKRAKWLIPVIIAAALVVIGGGSALAYTFWYQNPDKVVTDALLHAMEAKDFTYTVNSTLKGKETGDFTMSGAYGKNGMSADATLNFTTAGTAYTVKGSAVMSTDNAIYFKVANVDALSKSLRDQIPQAAQPAFDNLVGKVNNQWIKVTSEQSKNLSASVSSFQQCFQSAAAKLQSDNSYSSEIIDLFKAHPIMKITKQLGTQNGSLGYELQGNPTETKAFVQGFVDTKLYKMVHGCDSDFTVTPDSFATTTDTKDTNQIWINQWSHQITKYSVSSKADDGSDVTADIEPVFNNHPTIQIPQKSMSIDDLMKDIQDFETTMMETVWASQGDTPAITTPDIFSTQV